MQENLSTKDLSTKDQKDVYCLRYRDSTFCVFLFSYRNTRGSLEREITSGKTSPKGENG
jgi:hypothetical protein